MLVGTDSSKFPGAAERGAAWTFRRASELGLDGVFLRSPWELSATLDAGEMRDAVQVARDAGLYVQVGIGKVNPFTAPELPQIRAHGDGDYLRGLVRLVEQVTALGVHDLWAATCNYQFRYRSILACDRFREDVTWSDQLAATAHVLDRLGPVLRDHGAHLNLETHEEITSREVVALVEGAGPDAFGITFDTANVLVRGEDPVAAARRVAPYVRATHARDVALHTTADGIGRFLAPVGEGVLDWPTILRTLLSANPDLPVSIEGVIGMRAEMPLWVHDERWYDGGVDEAELAQVRRLTADYELRAAAGEVPGLVGLRAHLDDEAALDFVLRSAAALRAYAPVAA
ncbi:sugar phosphate isomerase/epimerase [Cellulomonas sp. DKR-3]|uniref:Sugar phosphate isomerase/epimerase n=1 Tax=Cellulomonas fulva TaxID=2835530 RepID=A0ABS5TX25_9CELL|nr:sugar phosphate isomerase/epimerase family protein [Cellulomonas fulva]MBT0993709.1 sugar phosphate isomerase/epimerase [Cellulomonas fulva]